MAVEFSSLTLILFFVYSYGLGFTITAFVRNSENFLERNLMRIGIGLAILPFLGIILSILRIPLDWRIFFLLSVSYPIIYLLKNFRHIKPKMNLTNYDITIVIMLLIFLSTFYMYHKGAFTYPYLEDDDPWSHAIGVKYVALEKTVFPDTETASHLQYIHPYPPSYDLLFGLLHQSSQSILWTLKFFNALIISLSIIFLFFFVKQFTNNKNKALYSALVLAMLPAYLSHFIWAIALTLPLYFVVFYCMERINEDKKWFLVSGIVIGSTLTISPSHSTYLGFFLFIYILAKTILQKRFLLYDSIACIIGVVLSFSFWWGIMILQYGLSQVLHSIGGYVPGGLSGFLAGTGDRIYTLNDFLFAKPQNLINSPIGIGLIISLLTLLSVFLIFSRYKKLLNKENHWLVITFLWFLFTLYAVNAAGFAIKLSPFRVWPLFAIPICILSAEAINFLMLIAKSIEQELKVSKIIQICLIILLVIGLWLTSGKQKYTLNTAMWPAGQAWRYIQDNNGNIRSPELEAYLSLKTLPLNTKVFSFTNDGAIISMDKFTCSWCKEDAEFKKNIVQKKGEEIYSWLRKNSYEYVILGQQEAVNFGINETNALLQKMLATQGFKPVMQTETTILMRVA